MKYLIYISSFLLVACNTASTEKERENDSAKVDGTRVMDTTMTGDSVPPNIQNPQPD